VIAPQLIATKRSMTSWRAWVDELGDMFLAHTGFARDQDGACQFGQARMLCSMRRMAGEMPKASVPSASAAECCEVEASRLDLLGPEVEVERLADVIGGTSLSRRTARSIERKP